MNPETLFYDFDAGQGVAYEWDYALHMDYYYCDSEIYLETVMILN